MWQPPRRRCRSQLDTLCKRWRQQRRRCQQDTLQEPRLGRSTSGQLGTWRTARRRLWWCSIPAGMGCTQPPVHPLRRSLLGMPRSLLRDTDSLQGMGCTQRCLLGRLCRWGIARDWRSPRHSCSPEGRDSRRSGLRSSRCRSHTVSVADPTLSKGTRGLLGNYGTSLCLLWCCTCPQGTAHTLWRLHSVPACRQDKRSAQCSSMYALLCTLCSSAPTLLRNSSLLGKPRDLTRGGSRQSQQGTPDTRCPPPGRRIQRGTLWAPGLKGRAIPWDSRSPDASTRRLACRWGPLSC